MARPRKCGHCGEAIRPGQTTRFDIRVKDVVFHEHCFAGVCLARGWSFLQKPGGIPPPDLIIDCAADCHAYGPAGQGFLVVGTDAIWYEREGDHYRPYHPACAPSKLIDGAWDQAEE